MKAKERAGAVWDQFTLDLAMPNDNRPPVTVQRIILAIEQAIIAAEEEKAKAVWEACAMIADEHGREESERAKESKSNGKGLSELGHVFEATAAKAIANKIRAQSEGEETKPLSFVQEIREEADRVWDIGKRIEAKEAEKKDDPRIWYELKQFASDMHGLARKLKAQSEGEKKGE